jgi:hypothetical protein
MGWVRWLQGSGWATSFSYLISPLLFVATRFHEKNRRRRGKGLGGFQNMFQSCQKLNFVSKNLQKFANIIVLVLKYEKLSVLLNPTSKIK